MAVGIEKTGVEIEALEQQYQQYKTWLKERHLDAETWVLNWDIKQEAFAEYGIGDSLFYTGIYLTALALEKNEAEFTAILEKLNQHKYLPGMYPRYPNTFKTSKDPYFQLVLALVYAGEAFPNNTLLKETLDEIVINLKANKFRLREHPDICQETTGSSDCNTRHGNLLELKPIVAAMDGKTTLLYYLALLGLPAYTLFRKLFIKGKYFNLFMFAAQYLMYHLLVKGSISRGLLKLSVKTFATIEKRNPYFLMICDLIAGKQKHRSAVEEILAAFPQTHLPNDEEPIAHQDVLWQRDPESWPNSEPQVRFEYSGIDFMVMWRFYMRHYLGK